MPILLCLFEAQFRELHLVEIRPHPSLIKLTDSDISDPKLTENSTVCHSFISSIKSNHGFLIRASNMSNVNFTEEMNRAKLLANSASPNIAILLTQFMNHQIQTSYLIFGPGVSGIFGDLIESGWPQKLSFIQKISFCIDCARAVEILHSNNILHSNLTSFCFVVKNLTIFAIFFFDNFDILSFIFSSYSCNIKD